MTCLCDAFNYLKDIFNKFMEVPDYDTNKLNNYIKRREYNYDNDVNTRGFTQNDGIYPMYGLFRINISAKYSHILYKYALESKSVNTFSAGGSYNILLAGFDSEKDLDMFIDELRLNGIEILSYYKDTHFRKMMNYL